MRKVDRKGILIAAAVIFASAALYFLLARPLLRKVEEGVYVGMRAPDITVVGVDGSRFRLSDHRGVIVILEFSTMWCPYCVKQIEVLKRLVEEFGERVYIASIDVDPAEQPTGECVRMMGVKWFYGHSPEAGLTYKVSYVPMVIVIDREGIIRYRGAYTTYEKLRSIILQIGG
jgi:peroxiredoxin